MSAARKKPAAGPQLREFALALPGAWEDFPWGDRVVKVGKKVFVFLGQASEEEADAGLGISVKLPDSGEEALTMAFTEPTGYGLGRAGWVSARFEPGQEIPVDILCDWIEESYRAVAPKKLVKELDARNPPA